jgi:hypothetical protein
MVFDKFIGHGSQRERICKKYFPEAIETKTEFRLECRIRRTEV